MDYHQPLKFELVDDPLADLQGPAPKPVRRDLPPSHGAKKRQFKMAMWELIAETKDLQYYRHRLFSDCFKTVFLK